MAKYNEWQETTSVGSSTRSKSKSPKRLKAQRSSEGESIPPSPSVNPIAFSAKGSANDNGGQLPTKLVYSGKSSRRPHTSAGPRDKPVNFAGKAYDSRGAEGNSTVATSSRSGQAAMGGCSGNEESANGVAIQKQPKRYSEMSMKSAIRRPEYVESYTSLKKSFLGGLKGMGVGSPDVSRSPVSTNGSSLKTKNASLDSNTKRNASSSSGSSGCASINTIGTCDESSSSSSNIREWEKELARIEARSRESSKLFALARKMKVKMTNFGSGSNASGVAVSD